MSATQTVGWPDVPPHHYYDLRAEPLGWWQRHILWLPFLKDTKPRFKLTVSCIQANVQSHTLRWFIRFENGTQTGHDIVVPTLI